MHPTRPTISDSTDAVMLHGHCHQKALWGSESSARFLRRLFGQRLEVLDTGCCGMAGSFGYTEKHYDLSMTIGEERLFPAVRKAESAVICAPGTSCRHQIHDGTGRDALHPVDLAVRALGL
jgi:Fe-S oxidoreductase